MTDWQGAASAGKPQASLWGTPRLPQGRVSVEELRAIVSRLSQKFGRLPKGTDVVPVQMGPREGEWVTRSGAEAPRIVMYLHGGGFIGGTIEEYRPLAARLAWTADARVLLVAYRRAPEHPFPAPLRDALEAYRWLLAERVPAGRIVLAGDGAGAGLVLGTLLAIRNAKLPQAAGAVLLSPWVDLAMTGWSMIDNTTRDRTLSWTLLAQCARHYLNDTLPTDAYASPLYADLSGLPPLFIQAGADELLRDDAIRVGTRAEAAGVSVDIEIHAGKQHIFQVQGEGLEAKGALARVGAFVRGRVSG